MSRIVLTGSPGALYQLQAGDLPADFDLRYSFWRYVDFRNFNLSAYNMNYMDIYDSLGGGVTLPTNIRLLESHRTDWTGAVIPGASLDNMMQDLISEEMRQRSATLTGRAKAAITASRNHLDYRIAGDSAYFRSWSTMPKAWADAGIATQLHINAAGTFFAGYPKLKRTFDQSAAWYTQQIPVASMPRPPSTVAERAEYDGVDLRPYTVGSLDRWATARALEALFPQYHFKCIFLFPVRVIIGGSLEMTQEPEL